MDVNVTHLFYFESDAAEINRVLLSETKVHKVEQLQGE